jgi:anti-anti-sigma regulatory factor
MLTERDGTDIRSRDRSGDAGIGEVIAGYRGGVTVLALVGEHADLGRGVVIVLSETEFIDSRIVQQLFRGDIELLKKGRRLVIQNDPDSTVEHVLELSGVRAQLVCSDTLDEAVQLASQCYDEQ